MSDTAWGLGEGRSASAPSKEAPSKEKAGARLSPKVAASAHNGIVWLHLSAIVVWLVIAAVFGAVAASGRDLPAVVFVATLGAAAGHAIFLAVHALFAALARRRQSSVSA
jgi:hypothetical protein